MQSKYRCHTQYKYKLIINHTLNDRYLYAFNIL